MKIHRLSAAAGPVSEEPQPCVIALGFFDGVHTAHMQVLLCAKEIAQRSGMPFAVMTFFPHPKKVLGHPDGPIRYITPMEEKIRIMDAIGVELLYLVDFDRSFAVLSSKDYVERYLIANGVRHVVAGFDFRYGHKGEGHMNLLKRQGEGYFGVTVVDEIAVRDVKISSSQIRDWLSSGELERIPESLGRWYETEGKLRFVSSSEALFGMSDSYLLPRSGCRYQVEVVTDHLTVPAVCDVASEPEEIRLRFDGHSRHFAVSSPVRIRWKQRQHLAKGERPHE